MLLPAGGAFQCPCVHSLICPRRGGGARTASVSLAEAEPTTCGLTTLAILLNALASTGAGAGVSSLRAAGSRDGYFDERSVRVRRGLPRRVPGGCAPAQAAGTARCPAQFDLAPKLPLARMLREGIDVDAFVECAVRAGTAATLTHAWWSDSAYAWGGDEPAQGRGGRAAGGSRGEAAFRAAVRRAARAASGSFLALSYSRYSLLQTGEGHFSPMGGYHAQSDSLLLMDSAKFKYAPHWVTLPAMWTAMQACDWTTGRPRGYIVVSHGGGVTSGGGDAAARLQ